MKFFPAKRFDTRIGLAASAVASALSVAFGDAHAGAMPFEFENYYRHYWEEGDLSDYIPSGNLTPYQIVSHNGSCLKNESDKPVFRACSENDVHQKFYITGLPQHSDFMPQQEAVPYEMLESSVRDANAYIYEAAQFDEPDMVNPSKVLLRLNYVGYLIPRFVLAGLNSSDKWRIVRSRSDVFLADEGSTFALTAPGFVRYGTASAGTVRRFDNSGPIWCKNESFGVDPAPGSLKTCSLEPRSTLAMEGSDFTIAGPGKRSVFYGSAAKSIQKTFDARPDGLTQHIPCTNTTFGVDPDPGERNTCYTTADHRRTPMRIFIQNPVTAECLSDSGYDSIWLRDCGHTSEWTLRPTSYPYNRGMPPLLP